MKRLIVAAAAMAAIVIGAGVFLPAALWRPDVETALADQVTGFANAPLKVQGEARLALFPYPHVVATNAVYTGHRGFDREFASEIPILTVKELKGRLELFPLLIGRVKVYHFSLHEPVVTVVRYPTGGGNWPLFSREAFDAISTASPDVGVVEFIDGQIVIDDRAAGETATVNAVNGTLRWPNVNRALAFDGSAELRGEEIVLDVNLGALTPLFFGLSTDTRVEIQADTFSGELNGDLRIAPALAFNGRSEVTIADPKAFAGWAGFEMPVPMTAFSINGRVLARRGLLDVRNADFDVGGEEAEGAFLLANRAGRTVFEGSIAFDEWTLERFVTHPGRIFSRTLREDETDAETDFDNTSLEDVVRGLAAADLDIDVRLSVQRALVGTIQFENVAGTVVGGDGRVDIGIANAELDGGLIGGSVVVRETDEPAASEPNTRVSLNVRSLPIQPLLSQQLGMEWIAGVASGSIELQGRSSGGHTAVFTGSGKWHIADGRLNIPDTSVAAAASPDGDVALRAFRAFIAEQPFETIDLAFDIDGPIAAINTLTLIYPNASLTGEGTAWFDQPALDIVLESAPRGLSQAETIINRAVNLPGLRFAGPIGSVEVKPARR